MKKKPKPWFIYKSRIFIQHEKYLFCDDVKML